MKPFPRQANVVLRVCISEGREVGRGFMGHQGSG